MKIKVCGMRQAQNIAEIAQLGVDYMGFIFYEKSPRYVGTSAPEWGQKGLNLCQKVGVFVNHSLEFVIEKINLFQLDLVQLHGSESVEFCHNLRLRASQIEIIKVFSIGEDFDFDELNEYKPVVDYFLFDTKGKNLGGNGVTFNWEILRNYDNEIPFFLSGGIDIQHTEEIKQLKGLNIHALDINSKFEVSAGLKEVEKIKKFMELLSL